MAQRRVWSLHLYTVLVVVTQGCQVFAGEVNLIGRGLTEIPASSSLPNSATSIYLGNNQISAINDYAFQGLTKLKMIYMIKNRVETIAQRAFYGTVLIEISLGDNLLTSVPYLGDIKNTIRTVMLSKNLIRILYGADFEGLGSLLTKKLTENPLTTVYDLHRLPPSLTKLDLTSIGFVCCRSMYLLKNISSSVLWIDAAPCVPPGVLVGEPWGDIAVSQLEHQTCGNVVYRCFSKCLILITTSNYSNYLHVIKTTMFHNQNIFQNAFNICVQPSIWLQNMILFLL